MYEERDSSTSAAVAQPKDSPSTRSTSQFFDCPPEVELKRFQFYFCTSDENPISAGSPTPVDLFPPTTTVGREPIIRQATADVDLTPYANGRGVVNYYLADKAREGRVHHVVVLCEPDKWEDAQYYDGGTKDPVYRFCIRLHEKHHKKNKNLLSSGSRYSSNNCSSRLDIVYLEMSECIPDPKDTGGGKPEKRDWLKVSIGDVTATTWTATGAQLYESVALVSDTHIPLVRAHRRCGQGIPIGTLQNGATTTGMSVDRPAGAYQDTTVIRRKIPITSLGEPRILEITKGIDYSPYANGRGAVDRGGFVRKSNKDYHKHIIDCKPGVWGDAKHYRGGRKDAIY
ncbi:hypothetical protein FOZ62_001800, partial [Perkinsus olseni]